MGRIIGLIGCTCLVIAVLRLSNMEHVNDTLRAGVDKSPAGKVQSAREKFRRGKELCLKGRYAEAALALESAAGDASGLTAAERRQAQDFLNRAHAKLNALPNRGSTLRGQSPEEEEFSRPVRHHDVARTRVERRLLEAQAALQQGKTAEARQMVVQAGQMARDAKLKFSPGELTPAQLLAKIDGVAKTTPKAGGIRHAGGPFANEQHSAVQLTEGVELEDAPAEDWSEGEVAEATEDAAEGGELSNEALARKLVASARADLKAGRFEEARRKALQADELDVAWSLFEDQPILILEGVDLRTDSTTIAKSAVRRKVETESANQGSRDSALALLKQARQQIEQGQLESAREKALAAQEMKVVYKTFDDRPELILQDIDAQHSAASNVGDIAATEEEFNDGQAAAPDMKQRKQQVHALLTEARKALSQGRLEEARDLALEAEKLQVPFSVFDDRPETVLADIDRSQQRQSAGGRELPGDNSGASVPRSDGANLAAKKLATELLRQSRELLAAGQLDQAYVKAKKAEQLDVPFEADEDQPGALLAQIEEAFEDQPLNARTKTTDPDVRGAASRGERGTTAQAGLEHADGHDELAPIGVSAQDHYNRGLAEMQRGNREEAYASFLAAHQSGQKLDRVKTQRLQNFLRELSPRAVRTAAHQETDAADPGILDTVEKQMNVQHDRLKSDVLNAVFKAERHREKDPEKGLKIIDQAIATVEGSELTGEGKATLLRTLQRTRGSLETTVAQQMPNIEQERKNKEVKAKVDNDIKTQIRIEQEFAKLVEEYNELFKQRRFAEAEVLAKKAQELDPREPAAATMYWKAHFARNNESNQKLRAEKEESFLKQLDDADRSSIVRVNDDKPVHFGDNWNDINDRRKGKYRADTTIRSDSELFIEKSLGKRISLHEDQVPFNEVIQKISALAGFNIYIDELGLEEEGVITQTPVSINVESIQVKSALNLLLERYNLAFTIQDEVLKITSRMRQQGDMETRTYPVADLVVPIPSQATGFAPGMSSVPMVGVPGMTGTGGAQFSVPPGGVQPQAFPQVGPNVDVGPLGLNTNSPRVSQPNRNYDFDSLTDLLLSTISPETWESVGGQASVRHYETTLSLVIRQTQRVHEEIADLLGQLRRLQDLQVTIEVRFVTVSDRFFERIGLDFDFNVPGTLGRATVDNDGNFIPPFGSILQPQQGQSASTTGTGTTGTTGTSTTGTTGTTGTPLFLTPDPERQLTPTNFASPTVVGMSAPNTFQQNFDIPFQQGSFDIGVPTFGGFDPTAGIQVGFAILSDIEAFFFIQAAQADQRNNLMFAPKVTLFNGQVASVSSFVSRPFVISVVPTVGIFATGFQPVIAFVPNGIFLTVTAVISADRRYVRLTVFPQFTNITDVFTFSFLGGSSGGNGQSTTGLSGGGFGGGGFGGGGQQGGGGFGGQGFGIGGGMGTSQLVKSAFTQVSGGLSGTGTSGQTGQTGQTGTTGGVATTVTIQQPITEVVNINTTVSVPDGGTVLLGGVKRLREGRAMAGVPILNKIPYISRLFKNTGVGRETESLMLMVTPRIIIQEEEEELLGIPTR